MTQFWFGFITAVAVIAVTIIAGALLSYRRSERKRQQSVDAIMANIEGQVSQALKPNRIPVTKELLQDFTTIDLKARKKGVH